jgi:hypothetical protein
MFGAAKSGANGMRLKIQIAATLLVILLFCQVGMGAKDDNKSEPYNYFRDYVGLNAEQIQSISNGKALAKRCVNFPAISRFAKSAELSAFTSRFR